MGKRSIAPEPVRANSPSVIGLEHGRAHARKHARRRNRSNNIQIGVLAVLAVGSVSLAGWAIFDYYQSELQREADEPNVLQPELSPSEAIDVLEEQPRWNGPGNPAFGVGDEPSQP